jgi:peptidoglycan hydrolase-like protein with peptidoglycan-binding domain
VTTQARAQASITQVRQAMVSNCEWAVAHHDQIYYAESRPIQIGDPPRTLPFTTDCSGFVTLMAKWSGAADPNGFGFNGYGNTNTMLEHSPHISQAESQPGDLLVFGLDPDSVHVVALIQSAADGNDALCVSHGRPGDPITVALSVEIAAHSGEALTFLQLQVAGSTQGDGNPYLPLVVDGDFGPETTKAMQWKLGVTADGEFGPVTKEALQRYLHVPADGIIGPVTIKALQAHVGASQDGVWGSLTTEALQRALNAGSF